MKDLLEAARRVRRRAWAPYSGFSVGAALRTAGGRIHVGCNIENAAHPEGLCAEAAAIAAMVAAGERRIREILVLGGAEPCAPCGGCRQKIAEFAPPEARIHMAGTGGVVETATLAELLPRAFALASSGNDGKGEDAAARIRARAPGWRGGVALLLGSGLGAIAEALAEPVRIPYAELEGFPRPTVAGHAGEVVIGTLEEVPLLCLSGRVHLYEGKGAAAVLPMIRTLRDLDCRLLIVTNAVGSLRPDLGPGSLLLVRDHINFQGRNPLLGLADAEGPPFLDLSTVYDEAAAAVLAAAAARAGVPLEAGTYLATLGPCFETPAEIRAFRVLGADVVGMSLVPEAIAARHFGLRVAALAIVTNPAAGLAPGPLSHAETLAVGRAAAERLLALLRVALPVLAGRSPARRRDGPAGSPTAPPGG